MSEVHHFLPALENLQPELLKICQLKPSSWNRSFSLELAIFFADDPVTAN